MIAASSTPGWHAFYERLGLNARQIALIANATPKRDYYLVSRDGCRLFELGLGRAALAFVGASRPENHALMDRVLKKSGLGNFAAAWLDQRGLRDAADAVRRFKATASPSKPNHPTAERAELVAAE